MFKRYIIILALALIVFLARPTQVFACSDWSLSCVLGLTDIADRDAQRRESETQINATKAQRIAEINSAADVAKRQADAVIQAQIEQGKISIEQARQMGESYRRLIDGQTQEKVTVIAGQTVQNIAALQGQTQIAIAGIEQAGLTTRERLMFESIRGIVIFAGLLLASMIIVACIVLFLRFTRRSPHSITQTPAWPRRTVREQEVYYIPGPVQTRKSEIVAANNVKGE